MYSSNLSGFSTEFLNVGEWLSRGDLALESKAHFLAVAEHRLVPARAPNVTTQLRRARRSSVWAPSCQDVTPRGHAGVGVISLYGTPLSLPTLFDPSFKEFFRIGRAMTVVLPLGKGVSPICSSFMAIREPRVTRRSFNFPIISLLLF